MRVTVLAPSVNAGSDRGAEPRPADDEAGAFDTQLADATRHLHDRRPSQARGHSHSVRDEAPASHGAGAGSAEEAHRSQGSPDRPSRPRSRTTAEVAQDDSGPAADTRPPTTSALGALVTPDAATEESGVVEGFGSGTAPRAPGSSSGRPIQILATPARAETASTSAAPQPPATPGPAPVGVAVPVGTPTAEPAPSVPVTAAPEEEPVPGTGGPFPVDLVRGHVPRSDSHDGAGQQASTAGHEDPTSLGSVGAEQPGAGTATTAPREPHGVEQQAVARTAAASDEATSYPGAAVAAVAAPLVGHTVPATEVAPAPRAADGVPVARQVAGHLTTVRLTPDGTHHTTLVLDPRELGPVRIRISVLEGSVTLHLTGSHAAACEVLREALPDLRRELDDVGLTLAGADVAEWDPGSGDHGPPARPRDPETPRPTPAAHVLGRDAAASDRADPDPPRRRTAVDVIA